MADALDVRKSTQNPCGRRARRLFLELSANCPWAQQAATLASLDGGHCFAGNGGRVLTSERGGVQGHDLKRLNDPSKSGGGGGLNVHNPKSAAPCKEKMHHFEVENIFRMADMEL